MRLLINGLNFAPEPTGCGKYTGELATWLAARGHEVEAIAAPPHYPQWRVDDAYVRRGLHVEHVDGVAVRRAPVFLRPNRPIGAAERVLLETSFSLTSLGHWLPMLVRPRPFDVCVAVCPPLQAGLLPALYARARNVPWVFHVQDLQVDAAIRLGLLSDRRIERPLAGVESGVLGLATRVSTISEAMQRRIVQKGIPLERTWVFPNWADLDEIHPSPPDVSVRRELGARDDEFLVMYAGNLGAKQGLESMLAAADRLSSNEKVRFAIVGDGVARSALVAETARRRLENVTFAPVQPRGRLGKVLNAADLHLVVQKGDAADLVMPSKLTNILAAGKPFVATAREETELGRATLASGGGVLSAPDDPDALEEAIRGLLNLSDRSGRLDSMGEASRRYAEERLGKEPILSSFEGRIRTLVRHGEHSDAA